MIEMVILLYRDIRFQRFSGERGVCAWQTGRASCDLGLAVGLRDRVGIAKGSLAEVLDYVVELAQGQPELELELELTELCLARWKFPSGPIGVREEKPANGKVHGSLARAGKVRGQTPKVAKQDKKKKPRGRAHKRMQYNRRFVTAGIVGFGKKRGPNSSEK
ncbi:hypothetical protein TEA_022213 [Camellia sinensis var. sinensis]|uniref:Uncharacterized protein n=1 Tax=Camellia sinensis var. sinensis TaxID=542762 RepID=A0A4S4DD04_CAMSN|nr:hypothetical protein TEA_022213 [Camellia sinensis var. sinensis]